MPSFFKPQQDYESAKPVRRGLFLTHAGLERTKEIFEKVKYSKKEAHISNIAEVINTNGVLDELFDEKWVSFDNIYAGMYLLNLFAGTEITARKSHRSGNHVERMTLDLMVDVEFPKFTKDCDFEATLLSEYVVADIIKLKEAIGDLVSYPITPRAFSYGCLFMGFSIFGKARPEGRDSSDVGMPGLNRNIIDDHPSWNSLKNRFKIRHIDLRPA
jgi:hypothetical protein